MIMAQTSTSTYIKFGYNHEKLGKSGLKAILDEYEIEYDHQATVYNLLTVVEKLFADKRVENGTATQEYLYRGFEPTSYTIPQLRQVLSYHDIPYLTARPAKSDLVDIFLDNIDVIREEEGYEAPISRDKRRSCTDEDLAAILKRLGVEAAERTNKAPITKRTRSDSKKAATTDEPASTTRPSSAKPGHTDRDAAATELDRRLMKSHLEQGMIEILHEFDQRNDNGVRNTLASLLKDIEAKKKRE